MEPPLQKKKNGRDEDTLFYLDSNGRFHGVWRCYAGGGKLRDECNDKHGIFHGLMRSWHNNDKLAYTGEFSEGRHVGVHQWYWPDSSIKSCIEYNTAGQKDGDEYHYYPNNLVQSYAHYKKGVRTGQGYFNWPNGKLAMEYNYDAKTERYHPENRK